MVKIPSKDIVRNYKRRFPVFKKQQDTKIIMESLISPEQQLDLARTKHADLVPAEVLYHHGFWETTPKVYQHYSEEFVKIFDNQIEVDFLSPESKSKILAKGYPLIHIGLILIGVHGLHRKQRGAKVLITAVDASDSNPQKATIGTLEVNMDKCHEICYLAPDFSMTIRDFCQYFKLIIKAKGYETMARDRSNLLITKALVGRLGKNSSTAYNLKVESVLAHLQTAGIKAVAGKEFSATDYDGGEWSIDMASQTTAPTQIHYWDNGTT